MHISFAPPTGGEAPSRSRGRSKDKDGFDDETEFHAQIEDLDADAPDPLIDGAIDLRAIVSEFLTLGLDLYPRSPGATFQEPAPEGAKDGPFAALRRRFDGGEKA